MPFVLMRIRAVNKNSKSPSNKDFCSGLCYERSSFPIVCNCLKHKGVPGTLSNECVSSIDPQRTEISRTVWNYCYSQNFFESHVRPNL